VRQNDRGRMVLDNRLHYQPGEYRRAVETSFLDAFHGLHHVLAVERDNAKNLAALRS